MAKAEKRSDSLSMRVSYTDPKTGKRRQKRITARTARELKLEEATFLASIASGSYVEPSKLTLLEWMRQWAAQAGGRESTQRERDLVILYYVERDPLGGVTLDKLQPYHLQAWITRRSTHLAPGTVRKNYGVIHQALRRAVELRIISTDPGVGVRAPKATRTPKQVYTEEHVRALIAGTRDDDLHAAWVLMATVGLRIGEVVALKWSDFDLERSRLTVHRTMTRVSSGTWKVGDEPKTASSKRTIVLPAITTEALRRHRTRQLERRLKAGSLWQDDDAVFDNGIGGFRASVSSVGKRFDRVTDALELPRMTVHGLRHTAATLAIRRGVPIPTVSQMLGHASPAITLGIYAHVIDRMSDDAADAIDAIYRAS